MTSSSPSASWKWPSLFLLMLAEISGMSLWFMSSAILPDLITEFDISATRQAALASAVQIGFVIGAIASSWFGIADRFDPRRVFSTCAVVAALANGALLVLEPGGNLSIVSRLITGAMLAGVYPVGMKIAVGWGKADRGLLVGTLVGALTFGSAAPHLLALNGGTDWRWSVQAASLAAGLGGLLCLVAQLGPYHSRAPMFSPRTILQVWTNRKIRLAYAGYLGHMWELYAMWAWIGLAAAQTFALSLDEASALYSARLLAFGAIAAGGVTSILCGFWADRVGKENIALGAVVISGTAALATAASFGGSPWLFALCALIWGAAILPDSAQYSALVADFAPPEQAGSLMTFQTALGFALTFGTVQVTPVLADALGWPLVFALMAIGPAVAAVAMLRLKKLR
ncbi:MFS transporter [Roseibium sp.]|uniref:MFS transporter n=1 Tax=Roseibium sp. TaxID=1936156 RepID=UPI003A982963